MPPAAKESPTAESSQPIGFAGFFQASSAPTVEKEPTKTTASTPFAGPPLKLAALAGKR